MFKRTKAEIDQMANHYAERGYNKTKIFFWEILAWVVSVGAYGCGAIAGYCKGFKKGFEQSRG